MKVIFLLENERMGTSSDIGHGEERGGCGEGEECPMQQIVTYHVLNFHSNISIKGGENKVPTI